MDRSADSIGSCSLDVDADSLDISDTSGSLNITTPDSVKDLKLEFTTSFKNRCSHIPMQSSTSCFDNISGEICVKPNITNNELQSLTNPIDISNIKKPSYLNLACCVNGYSNLTTYDSKVRQDINKSREVSPIRPSSCVTLQNCKNQNSIPPPVLHKVPYSISGSLCTKKLTSSNKPELIEPMSAKNSFELYESINKEKPESISFIQQRVERLYGPGAFVQVLCSPSRVRGNNTEPAIHKQIAKNPESTELILRFKELSPCKDYDEINKKIKSGNGNVQGATDSDGLCKNNIDLPVLRHLSQEFRSQLPSISPKRNFLRNPSSVKDVNTSNYKINAIVNSEGTKQHSDDVDHKAIVDKSLKNNFSPVNNIDSCIYAKANENNLVKDGNYFLKILKCEQIRLLELANQAENFIDILSNNPDITEDTFGLLRSASGKARLLVSQKMKQFEGLCYSNLNRKKDDGFPTTIDDLQGFWDMVYLQVDHINSIFADIESLKKNNWKRPIDDKQDISRHKKIIYKSVKSTTAVNCSAPKNQTTKSAAALKRESQRKQFLELKRKNKNSLAAKTTSTSDVDLSMTKTIDNNNHS